MGYRDRLQAEGPRKLLALDGGGIQGVLTLEILSAIEDIVRTKLGKDAVLADYFDYVAGTSTGAVIAAGLSRGLSVDEIRTIYHQHGKEMFDRAFILDLYRYKFDSSRLQQLLQKSFGENTTFGDDELKTLLMVVLRNATTDSPWPLSNNPGSIFNAPSGPTATSSSRCGSWCAPARQSRRTSRPSGSGSALTTLCSSTGESPCTTTRPSSCS